MAKNPQPSPDTFKLSYYLMKPPVDDANPAVSNNGKPNILPTNSTKSNATNNQTDVIDDDTGNYTYSYSDPGSSGSSSGTAIVIVIAVLIVVIPLGFVIQCIVRKIRERRGKQDGNEPMPLPDQSQLSQAASPDH
jgi:hypothetical protein